MTTRGKQVEVTSARNRLDATLQHLVDRKEDSASSDIDVTSLQGVPSVSKLNFSPSNIKKPAARPNRKRKRRSDLHDLENADEHTVIMKLFDRSADLAQFPEETPLYPVCRAWIHNRPHDKSLGTFAERPATPPVQPTAGEEFTDGIPNVYEMPPPIKSEDGCLYDLRVPEPVPQPAETLDIHADKKNAPSAESILLNHITRWKEIRNKWREASIMNEMQYAGSMQLLKRMFEHNAMENS